MNDVFLSYDNRDKERVQPLVHQLQASGLDVFWDAKIQAGSTWRDEIGHALNSARCIVVVWSENSVSSQWVQEEADEGRQRGILVPVNIDSVRPPLGFGGIQVASLVGWEQPENKALLERAIETIRDVIETPATTKENGRSVKSVKSLTRRLTLSPGVFRTSGTRFAVYGASLVAFIAIVALIVFAVSSLSSRDNVPASALKASSTNGTEPIAAAPESRDKPTDPTNATGLQNEYCDDDDPPVSCLFDSR